MRILSILISVRDDWWFCGSKFPGGRTGRSCSALEIVLGEIRLCAVFANTMREFGFAVFLNVVFQAMPVSVFVADIFAIRAGGEDAAESFYFLESLLERDDQCLLLSFQLSAAFNFDLRTA